MRLLYLIVSGLLMTNVSMAQSITEVLFPKYMQGSGDGIANEKRVPFVCRLTINGLTPNATYRYFNRLINNPDNMTLSGQGGIIIVNADGSFVRTTISNLSQPGTGCGEFTTNASGSYTGWFANEAGATAAYFAPGTDLYMRISLNNGDGGTTVVSRPTTTNSVKVINFGTSGTGGTAFRSTPAANAVGKNFVFLYDNVEGTGRPVGGTYIESDGVANTVANGYADFYANDVDGVDKAWGTIIPNTLATGIRNMSQYNLTNGALIDTFTSVNGIWPAAGGGTISTVNPSGGLSNVLTINGSVVTLPIALTDFTGYADDNGAVLQWHTASENNLDKFILERSKDAKIFYSVSSVDAKGDNSFYNYKDELCGGADYYRLQMIEANGETYYSNIVKIRNTISENQPIVYPNPVSGNTLSIRHQHAGKNALMQILDMNGQIVCAKNITGEMTQTDIDISMLCKGNYVLVINGSYNSGLLFRRD